MIMLKDYVDWGLTHSDKTANAEGVPLILENCVNNKKLKQLEVYGQSVQNGTPTPETPVEVESVGELVTDSNNTNYGKYKIPVTVRGKNLFMPTKVSGSGIKNDGVLALKGAYGTTIDSTDFSDNKVVVTQVPNENYATGAFQNGYICFLIPELVKGKIYTLSFDMNITANPLNATSYVICVGTTTNKGISLSSATRYSYTFSFTPRTDRPQQVEIRCGGMSYELSDVMITEEGQDDTFEPHIEPITTNVYLNEPLRKIGDYADYIDFKSKKVVRRIYENILNSSNNTYNVVNTGTMTGLRIQYVKATADKVLPTESGLQVSYYTLCNMYPSVTSGKRGDRTVSGSTTNMNAIDIIDLNYPTVDDWKIHLQELYDTGNPLILTHALRTPYEEPIECELPTLNAKTTVIYIGTSILPSNIKCKYIKK